MPRGTAYREPGNEAIFIRAIEFGPESVVRRSQVCDDLKHGRH